MGRRPRERPARDNGAMEDVEIRDETIKLGQLLKLAGLAEHGAEAKDLLADEQVLVNDELETRRGRQLVPGDVVALEDGAFRVVRQ